MTPTPESLRWTAAAIEAKEAGKPIEQRNLHSSSLDIREWKPFVGRLEGIESGWEYRPKPEPATVPWDCADDVPGPVCYLRIKDEPYSWSMVLGAGKKGIIVPDYHGKLTFNYEELERVEHSTDRKTWHPCTKEAKA